MPEPDGDQDGQTPLTPDQLAGLIPGHIRTRGELDELESENIRNAMAGLSRRTRGSPLTIDSMKDLHERMFGDVWEWAGQYSAEYGRLIGADANQIEGDLRTLIDYVRYWIDNDVYPDRNELLAKFHHRLTQIHPFPNGNGRWSRLMTDQLAKQLGLPTINWGRADPEAVLHRTGTAERDHYIDALRTADGHDIRPLTDLIRVWSDDAQG